MDPSFNRKILVYTKFLFHDSQFSKICDVEESKKIKKPKMAEQRETEKMSSEEEQIKTQKKGVEIASPAELLSTSQGAQPESDSFARSGKKKTPKSFFHSRIGDLGKQRKNLNLPKMINPNEKEDIYVPNPKSVSSSKSRRSSR